MLATDIAVLLIPLWILLGVVVVVLVLGVLARIQNGRYLRPIVSLISKVPLFRAGSRGDARGNRATNPELASAMRQLEPHAKHLHDPARAQKAMSQLTREERAALLEVQDSRAALSPRRRTADAPPAREAAEAPLAIQTVSNPDVGFDIEPRTVLEVDRDERPGRRSCRPREDHPRPLLPLRDGSPRSSSSAVPWPGARRPAARASVATGRTGAVTAPPRGVAVERDERIPLLPRRTHRRHEGVEPVPCADRGETPQDRLGDPEAAVLGTTPATIAHSVVGVPSTPSVSAQFIPRGDGLPFQATRTLHA
jgi:hypothetical protein